MILHMERPNGSFLDQPITEENAREFIERLAPYVPHDAVWEVTRDGD